MRLGQFVLVALVTPFVKRECLAAATKSGIVPTGAATAAENGRNLLSFGDIDTKTESAKEERLNSGAIAAGEGGRVGAGETVVSTNPNGGGTVTVTIYNNNGLWQRIKRWWMKSIYNEERASSTIVSGEGGRAGAGGTVVSSGNSDGGGTITVTIFNNNGLFQRIVRWWKSLWGRQVANTSTNSRLRQ